jgi:capsule polysaccharide modification protein KpsS
LERFWLTPGKVAKGYFLKYKSYIINKSQIKGSFYNKIF